MQGQVSIDAKVTVTLTGTPLEFQQICALLAVPDGAGRGEIYPSHPYRPFVAALQSAMALKESE